MEAKHGTDLQNKTESPVIIEADFKGVNNPWPLFVFGGILAVLGLIFYNAVSTGVGVLFFVLSAVLVVICVSFIIKDVLSDFSMTLTAERVYGRNKDGEFDIRVSDITGIERGPMAFAIHTKTGAVLVPFCKNMNEVYEAVEARIPKSKTPPAKPQEKTPPKPQTAQPPRATASVPQKPAPSRGVKYEYVQQKLAVVQNTFVKVCSTLSSVGYTMSESQLRDDLLLFCVSIISARGHIEPAQLRTLNTILGLSFTESDLKQYVTADMSRITYEDMPIFAFCATVDASGVLTTDNSQRVHDLFAEVGYAIVCAGEEVYAAQEKRYDALMNNIRDGLVAQRGGDPIAQTLLTPALLGTGYENPYACKHIPVFTPQDVAAELEKRHILQQPIMEYRKFIDPFYVALYPQNHIDGSFAIVSGNTLHLLNLCAIDAKEGRISTYNDAQGLRDTLIAGAVGGAAMGMIVGAMSENHTVVEEVTLPMVDTETSTTFDVVFSKNETYSKEEWLHVFEGAQAFSKTLNTMLEQVTEAEKVRHTSYVLYGRENPRLTQTMVDHT